jgi:hypothetical protein
VLTLATRQDSVLTFRSWTMYQNESGRRERPLEGSNWEDWVPTFSWTSTLVSSPFQVRGEDRAEARVSLQKQAASAPAARELADS